MRQQRYFPSRYPDQVRWLLNFRNKLPAYQSALALPLEEVIAAVADAGWVAYLVGDWQKAAAIFSKTSTAAFHESLHGTGPAALPDFTPPPLPEGVVPRPKGALARLFAFIRRLKNRPGFDAIAAADLGLNTLPAPAPATPRFLARLQAGPDGPGVRLMFWKYNHEAVTIETRRNGGPAEELPPIVVTPWHDTRPLLVAGQPEMRGYRMRFWDKGTAHGEWTPWREIAVGE